ncbi:hypothetical protein ABZ366_06835 [Streptomyces sp. NPDC005904]|uniref:hypothetical protein n=1 Tax=Streptomyces sp. NPDC005904 TaxID=3154570 RepID=UPI0033F4240C
MRGEDALEIVRASLALAMPTASTDGLTRAAEAVLLWGSEDAADHLDESLSRRMLVDLFDAAHAAPSEFPAAEPEQFMHGWDRNAESVAQYRTWAHTDDMADLIRRTRPPEPDDPIVPFA